VAKKNTKNTDQSPGSPVATPPRRRAPAKKPAPAAAPLDVATIGGTEPIERAADTGGASPGGNGNNAGGAYQPTHEEIAQAAYFRHLNRGGTEGGEFDDWVEAERELRQRRK